MVSILFGGLKHLFRDLLSALGAILAPGRRGWILLAQIVIGLFVGWLIYVPIHEMLHAAGCVAAGGTVSELAIAPIHGAELLGRFFPFVVSSSSGYAGRLTGFRTGGSDLVLLATDFAPYLLTILIGVPLLRSGLVAPAAPGRWRAWRAWLLGPSAILAAAPFISLTGDYFEMASVILTRGYSAAGIRGLEALRSDDLFLLLGMLYEKKIVIDASPAVNWTLALSIITVSLLLALALASATYRLGIIWASLLNRRRGS
jgi:hypothetical protein